MSEKHLSTQFDSELSGISTRVLEMGGLVESQVAQAVYALTNFSGEVATEVLRNEERVNTMEIEIDRDLSTIIARRQPTARDLRLLIAISKTIANLERVGDEAARIARTVQRLIEGIFLRRFGMHIHVWRKFDSDFRLITARRNPNMVILFAAMLASRPDLGLIAVAWWTVLSCLVHAVRLAQAELQHRRGEPVTSWLMG